MALLEKNKQLLEEGQSENVQKVLGKLFVRFVQVTLQKQSIDLFRRGIEFFKGIKVALSVVICNKVLDHLNKHSNNELAVEYFMKYMLENLITPNLVTYNTIMDYYCTNRKFQRAMEVYDQLKKQGLQLDNYTFSILLKGLKGHKDPSSELIQYVYSEYKKHINTKDVILYNSFIELFVHFNDLEHA